MRITSKFFLCLKNLSLNPWTAQKRTSPQDRRNHPSVFEQGPKCEKPPDDFFEKTESASSSKINIAEICINEHQNSRHILHDAFYEAHCKRYENCIALLDNAMPDTGTFLYSSYMNLRAYAFYRLENIPEAEFSEKECLKYGSLSPLVVKLSDAKHAQYFSRKENAEQV